MGLNLHVFQGVEVEIFLNEGVVLFGSVIECIVVGPQCFMAINRGTSF